MKLILIRHAEAIERGTDIVDSCRCLTPAGRLFFRKTARTLEKHGVAPDLILTSPLLRAVQTADILAESLVYNGPLIAEEALGPGFDLANIKPLLEQYRHIDELVIVGHEPDLGNIVSEILNLPQGFTFKKGSAVRLNVKPTDVCGSAVFKWLASGRKLITSRKEACG